MIFPREQTASGQAQVPIELAATVMLVRDKTEGSMEVYLTQRHQSLVFLGGYHVFPGGRLDDTDYADGVEELSHTLSHTQASEILGLKESSMMSLGYWAAAIREVFEEAGVLLVCNKNGDAPSLSEPETRAKMEKYREDLLKEKITMSEILKAEGLYYAANKLCYHSHWITPPGPPRRFDTRFFIAELPEGQEPSHYSEEAEEGIWIEPQEALDSLLRREIKIIPPTIMSLRALAQHNTTASLLSSHAHQ